MRTFLNNVLTQVNGLFWCDTTLGIFTGRINLNKDRQQS
jgi:hypothetical protein